MTWEARSVRCWPGAKLSLKAQVLSHGPDATWLDAKLRLQLT